MRGDEDQRVVRVDPMCPAEQWQDFTSARERFLALLACQAAERRRAAQEGRTVEGPTVDDDARRMTAVAA